MRSPVYWDYMQYTTGEGPRSRPPRVLRGLQKEAHIYIHEEGTEARTEAVQRFTETAELIWLEPARLFYLLGRLALRHRRVPLL